MSKHSNKHIREAIYYALTKGWKVMETGSSSHAYCRLYCPENRREGCKISVWSTTANPENHTKQIIRQIDRCKHR